MDLCPFCGVTIDKEVASAAAAGQEKVNRAYSDASFIRTASIAMFVFLGLSFIPLIPIVYWGFLVTFVVVIAMIIRWQLRFGRLQPSDPDYWQATYRKDLALVLWLLAIPAGFVLYPPIAELVNDFFFDNY